MDNIRPFRMLENVYFVGGREVSVHVIDTGAGLVMIDSGYPHMRDSVLDNMRAVGLDPARLKVILLSHGHIDHTANAAYYRQLTGAKIAISRVDNDIVNGKRDLSWARELGLEPLPPFEGDILLDDGGEVVCGDTRIRCLLSPGHTEGTLVMLFDTVDRGRRLTCAMHGGVGINSMALSFLRRYGLPEDLRERFREGLHRAAREKVDVVLGNHPGQSDTEGKLARLLAGDADAFIDPGEWPRFLAGCEASLDEMLKKESGN